MSKLIFRKIAGRIVPIKIGPSKKVATSMGYNSQRIASAFHGKKKIGSIEFGTVGRGNSVFKVKSIDVNKEYQGSGIGTELFDKVVKIAERAGIKKIEGTEIINPAAVKIRSKYDTDFFRKYRGSTRKKISQQKALETINKWWKSHATGWPIERKDIRAVTKVKKK